MWNCSLPKMGISTLNLSLSFTLALILISSIIIISFKIDAVDAAKITAGKKPIKIVDTSCRGANWEMPEASKAAVRLNDKGNDFLDIGKYERAIIYYDLAIDEGSSAALYNKGLALNGLEKYEEAIEYFDKALKALDEGSNDAHALHGKGIAHSGLGKYEEAIAYFELAVDEEPNYAKALKGIGNAYYNLGQYKKAIEYYDKALDKDPNCKSALKDIAQDKLDNNNISKRKLVKQVTNEEPLSSTTNATGLTPSVIANDNNNPPVASASSITTTTNKPIDTQLLASDKDNDELTASIVSTPSKGVLSQINQENGMVTYTSINGFTGTDTFTFKVNDGKIDSNSGHVTITVEQEPTVIPIANDTANNPPFAHDESVTTSVNKPIDITLPSSDPDQNDDLTASIVFQPSNGVLSDINQNTGVVTYTPNTDFASSDNFMFKVNDGKTDSNSGHVTITVEQEPTVIPIANDTANVNNINPLTTNGDVEDNQQPQPSQLPSITDELTKLGDLKDKGIITEEEFSILKNDLLRSMGITTITTTDNIPVVDNGNNTEVAIDECDDTEEEITGERLTGGVERVTQNASGKNDNCITKEEEDKIKDRGTSEIDDNKTTTTTKDEGTSEPVTTTPSPPPIIGPDGLPILGGSTSTGGTNTGNTGGTDSSGVTSAGQNYNKCCDNSISTMSSQLRVSWELKKDWKSGSPFYKHPILCNLSDEMKFVFSWIKANKNKIIEVGTKRGIDPVAIAGAIAWEALENVKEEPIDRINAWSGPGKVHYKLNVKQLYDKNEQVLPYLLNTLTVAEQVEIAGYLPESTEVDRREILSSTSGSIEYIGAIMRALADVPKKIGYNIDNDPSKLSYFYNVKDLNEIKEWAKDKKYPDPIIIAEKMGPWVKNNLDYLKAALYEICQT